MLNKLRNLLKAHSEAYPYQSGDQTILGPGIFVSKDRSTINWNGVNYYRDSGWRRA